MKKDVDMVDTPKRDEKEGTKVDALPKPERELLNPTQQLASGSFNIPNSVTHVGFLS